MIKPLLPIFLLDLLLATSQLPAVTLLQVDTFTTPGTAAWGGGQTIPPTVTPGGPTGDYLVISSFDFHLGMKNQDQWTGDYLSAGVSSIEADILADPDLNGNLRIFLFGPGGTWSNQAQVNVPAASGWGHYSFDLTVSNLVFVPPGTGGGDPGQGTMTLNDTLASVQTVLIRHNTTADPASSGSHADHVTGAFGFDNITAIPEPSTALPSLLAAASLLLRRRHIAC